jgi:large subunit ribosomal protein L16
LYKPNKTKFKKIHKGRLNIKRLQKKNNLYFGFFGLMALQSGILYPYQFRMIDRMVKQRIKKKEGQYWLKVFPHHQKTKKSLGVRMGKGKGPIFDYFNYVRQNQIICEIKVKSNVYTLDQIMKLLMSLKEKISINTVIISKTITKKIKLQNYIKKEIAISLKQNSLFWRKYENTKYIKSSHIKSSINRYLKHKNSFLRLHKYWKRNNINSNAFLSETKPFLTNGYYKNKKNALKIIQFNEERHKKKRKIKKKHKFAKDKIKK